MRWCSTGVFSDGCDNAKLLSSLCRKLPNLTVQVEIFGVLNHDLKPINPFAVGYHRRHYRLKQGRSSLHVIVTLGDGVNLGTPLVMGKRPIERNYLAASPLIGVSHFP